VKFVLYVHKLLRGELLMVAINTAGSTRRLTSNTERTTFGIVDLMAVPTTVLRPVIVTLAVAAAAVGSTPAAHADSIGDAMAPVLNSAGIGNNGPISSAIAQVGQSICPMLVKPGSSFAGSAAQVSGHGGLAPPLAGFLVGMAIQSQCPSFMTSVANGNMPFPIPGGTPAGTPFGPAGAPSPVPLQLPGL
jgi:hypothetical protein